MAANPLPSAPARFEIEKYKHKVTVVCHGKLTCETAPELRAVVKPLIHVTNRIVLDLSDVPYMDSGALGIVMGLYTSMMASRQTRIRLINLSPRVEYLLGVTRLISLFDPPTSHRH